MNILLPDHIFPEPDVERASAGEGFELRSVRWTPTSVAAIDDATWAWADGMILYDKVYVTPELADRMRNCRILCRAGVGYDSVDVAACAERGIAVCVVPDYGVMDVAEHAMGLIYGLLRGIAYHDIVLRRDVREQWRANTPPIKRRVAGSKLGVAGLGRIGLAMAMLGKGARMDVRFFDPYVPTGTDTSLGIGRVGSLEELLAWSDVVSLHMPMNDETRHMIRAETLAHANPELVVINTARGGLVNIDDLYDALKAGRIAGAGLDVLPKEPPDDDPPLVVAWRDHEPWAEGRIIITPHASYFTRESILTLRRRTGEIVGKYLREGVLENCVNAKLLKR